MSLVSMHCKRIFKNFQYYFIVLMTVRKMKWNDTVEGRNLEVKLDQKRTSVRMPRILGGRGE